MGWLRGAQGSKYDRHSSEQSSVAYAQSKQNMSMAGNNESPLTQSHPIQESTVPDDKLPFIPATVVRSKRQVDVLNSRPTLSGKKQDYWIVVDGIVYDCTTFLSDHPGGEQVILSFVGEDCSWQFWRFHGKNDMKQYGRALRVGRTQGVANRFPEPVRFVGLSKIGSDEW